MSPSPLTGKVQTVLGPIEPVALGITQTHEHLLIDMGCYFAAPAEASERAWIHKPLTMDGLGWAWRRFAYYLDFQQLLDVQVAIEEISRYKYAGGNSLVDATSVGIARDPLALTRISRATGLNVIMGSSYYVPVSYPPDMDQRSEDEIFEKIVANSDDRPTQQSYEVFEELSGRVDAQLSQLRKVVEEELDSFKNLIAELEVPAVVPKSIA